VSLHVDEGHFKKSIHGTMFTCQDCHKGVKAEPHATTPPKVACVSCHADEQAAWEKSEHGKARRAGDQQAARCEDCHGGVHEILPSSDPESPVSHARIPVTCGRCHGQKFVMQATGRSDGPYVSYQESVHGKAIAAGKNGAAVCTDCHGSHEILPGSDPKSPIFKFNVPTTCGKCHQKVEQQYSMSIHGQALARGNGQTPVCTDCHGIHSIKSHQDPTSSVSALNLARTTCARCHEGVRLSDEFDMERHPVSTYLDSYHGLASQSGSQVVANCASCHGVHDILPSSDPRSKISPAHLAETCGACHPGVSQKFIQTRVHEDGAVAQNDFGAKVVKWIRRIYLVLIFIVIGAMLAHNLVIWFAKALAKRRAHGPVVLRMTKVQRGQHLVLLVSFVVLVVTGFALKFPHSWFAVALGLSEHLRSIAHRTAGVVMIAAGVYHILYAVFTPEGRRLVWDLLPGPKDVVLVVQTMLYYTGLGKTKPQSGRFTYGEKAEYWALVWGGVLMAVTGIMLWAPVTVGNLLARWWVDAATAVHFYEAILATLAILVWHLYQVIFDPDVYPMNWAWWNGKMPRELYEEEHPLDTAALEHADDEPEAPKQ
jgi:cytochrome b subunit of formate dehydrogenase